MVRKGTVVQQLQALGWHVQMYKPLAAQKECQEGCCPQCEDNVDPKEDELRIGGPQQIQRDVLVGGWEQPPDFVSFNLLFGSSFWRHSPRMPQAAKARRLGASKEPEGETPTRSKAKCQSCQAGWS